MKMQLKDLWRTDTAELFLRAGLVDSKNEARRLMKQGGLKFGDWPVQDSFVGWSMFIPADELSIVLSRGKKRKVLLELEHDDMQLVPCYRKEEK